jgi:hypothetical protein
MEVRRGYLQAYVLVVILFALLTIIFDLFSLIGKSFPTLAVIISILTLFFLLYNAVTLTLFIKARAPFILLFLPAYFLLAAIVFSLVTLLLNIFWLLGPAIILILTIISIASSLFEFGFVIYLVKYFEPKD